MIAPPVKHCAECDASQIHVADHCIICVGFVDGILVVCPCCGLFAALGTLTDGTGAAMHDRPACEVFDQFDPPDFAGYCRSHYVGADA